LQAGKLSVWGLLFVIFLRGSVWHILEIFVIFYSIAVRISLSCRILQNAYNKHDKLEVTFEMVFGPGHQYQQYKHFWLL